MPRWLIDSLATGGPALVVADAVAKATILLCLTTAVAAVLRRSAAAVRHRLWGLTLCGLIVLPLLSWSLPGWRLPILPSTMGLPGSRASWNRGNRGIGVRSGCECRVSGRHSFDATRLRSWPARADTGITARPPERQFRHVFRSSSMIRSLVALASTANPPGSCSSGCWGSSRSALPALAGVVGNEWRRRQSRRVVDQNWLQLLDGLTRQFALRRRIELRTSPVPLIPVTWGVCGPSSSCRSRQSNGRNRYGGSCCCTNWPTSSAGMWVFN